MAAQEVGIYSNTRDPIPSVLIDVILTESHSAENQVTELPLEDGSPITDHVIIKPDIVEISVEVGNHDGPGARTTGERAKTAWQQLKQLRNNRELLTITTEHEIYENMVISSLTANHMIPFSGRMIYTCKFQKLDITNLSIVKVPESILFDRADIGPPVSKTAGDLIESGVVAPITKATNPSLLKTVAAKILENSIKVLTGQSTVEELIAAEVQTGGALIESGIFTAEQLASANIAQVLEEAAEIIPFDTSGSRSILTNFIVGGARSFLFTTKFNYKTVSWSVDIADADGNDVAVGRQLVPGLDILRGLPDMKRDLGSIIVIDMKPELFTQALPTGVPELGASDTSHLIAVSFGPGVWEDIEEENLIPDCRPPQFDIFDLGWTVAPSNFQFIDGTQFEFIDGTPFQFIGA